MTTARSELEGQIAAKGLALGTARVVYSTKIDVETEPGEFSEFIITLPRGNGTAAGSKPE